MKKAKTQVRMDQALYLKKVTQENPDGSTRDVSCTEHNLQEAVKQVGLVAARALKAS